MGGGFYGMLLLSQMFKTSWQMGEHHGRDDSEDHLKDRASRSEQWLNIFRFLRKIKIPPIWARQFFQAYSSDVHCSRRECWRGDILVADIEELEVLDASEIHAQRLNAVRTTEKLIKKQKDIARMSTIDWDQLLWRGSSLLCDGFLPDSVLCFGISAKPIQAWKDKIEWYLVQRYLKELDRIDGDRWTRLMVIQWNSSGKNSQNSIDSKGDGRSKART